VGRRVGRREFGCPLVGPHGATRFLELREDGRTGAEHLRVTGFTIHGLVEHSRRLFAASALPGKRLGKQDILRHGVGIDRDALSNILFGLPEIPMGQRHLAAEAVCRSRPRVI